MFKDTCLPNKVSKNIVKKQIKFTSLLSYTETQAKSTVASFRSNVRKVRVRIPQQVQRKL